MNDVIENGLVPVDNDNIDTAEVLPNKRRRKKSIVWQYFTVESVSPGCSRAFCKQCKKSFAYIKGSKQAGTSHLKRHIDLGICPVNRLNQEKIQLSPYTPGSQNGAVTAASRKRCRASPGSVTIALDRERCINEIARMIILHDYPLHMVEQRGFIAFTQTLQPYLSIVSVDSVQSEIVAIHRREKQMLANLFAGIPGRVSLSMDLWTSDQTLSYAILTGHVIDADWKLQCRVLNFVVVPFPDSEVALNHAIVSCLSDWGLESRLFALTLDQSFANAAVVRNLRGLLSIKNPQMLNGQFLIEDCYARVMSRLAQEAIGATREVVCKLRDCIKFVKKTESRRDKSDESGLQRQAPCIKNLVIDKQGKWDSTYHMLSTACKLRDVFSSLDASDPDYKGVLSLEDWKHIEALCAYLKLFLDATDILTSETYPTASDFFHEICKIQLELTHGASSEDSFTSNLARSLYEMFDKYWRKCCVVLAMAVAMDPRFKLKLVEYSFNKIYGDEAEIWIHTVDEAIHELYFEYIAQTLPLPSIHVEQRYEGVVKVEPHQGDAALPPSDGLTDFDIYISEISSSQQTKSELDQYLDELLLPRESEAFNVVEWWKLNRIKYPILSKMAADILSIPVATVSRHSVFDTMSKKLDSYRCSLEPVTLEALVCANNWLQFGAQQNKSMFNICKETVEKELS